MNVTILEPIKKNEPLPSEKFFIETITEYIKRSKFPKALLLNKLSNDLEKSIDKEKELQNKLNTIKSAISKVNESNNNLKQKNKIEIEKLKHSI